MIINEDYMTSSSSDYIQEWIDYMAENTEEFPAYLSWFHGITHWKYVEAFGLMMADEVPEADREVIRWFAYLHDCCRGTEGYCEEHGNLAAKFIGRIRKTFLRELTDEQVKTLKLACKSHTVRRRTGNITADICLDADRLDLPRVNVNADPKKMATSIGALYAKIPYRELLRKARLL